MGDEEFRGGLEEEGAEMLQIMGFHLRTEVGIVQNAAVEHGELAFAADVERSLRGDELRELFSGEPPHKIALEAVPALAGLRAADDHAAEPGKHDGGRAGEGFEEHPAEPQGGREHECKEDRAGEIGDAAERAGEFQADPRGDEGHHRVEEILERKEEVGPPAVLQDEDALINALELRGTYEEHRREAVEREQHRADEGSDQ